MATFIQEGVYLDHTPEAALAQGDVVKIEDDFFGVATGAIAAGVQGALAVQGVFEFDSAGAIPAGALVFWDSVTSKVSATPAADDCYIGRAVAAAADDKCRVALNASNIGDFTPIVPGASPAVTQETFAALTAVDPDEINAVAPTVAGPTTTGIEGTAYATEAAAIKAAIEQNDANVDAVKAELDELIDDVTAIRTQLVAAIADLETLRTAVNAAKTDLAAVVTQLKAASVLQ
jgi:predicted RecA/RadA family phage recombinase